MRDRSKEQGSTESTQANQTDRPSHRLRIEEVVVQVSLLLASTSEINYFLLLEMLGEGTEAECVYLQRVPAGNHALDLLTAGQQDMDLLLWSRTPLPASGREEAPADPHRVHLPRSEGSSRDPGGVAEELLTHKDVLAVPVLSVDGRFHGYIGLAYGEGPPVWREEDRRMLGVVGDMLAGYFERQRAEKALQESEERYRSLVERNPEPILITTPDAVVYVNPAGCELFGVEDPGLVLGRSLFDFLSAEEHHVLEEAFDRLREGKSVEPFQHEVARVDGSWRIVESFPVSVLFEGQQAFQIVLQDITDRKAREQRYRSFIETISEGIWYLRVDPPIATTAAPALQAQHIHRHGVLAECNRVMAQVLGGSVPEEVLGRPFWITAPDTGFSTAIVHGGYRIHNWPLADQQGGDQQESGRARHFLVNASGVVERGSLVGIWGSCTDVTENVELQRHMVTVLEEQQQQIGRELHDGVGQFLTSVRMLTQVLLEHLGERDAAGTNLARKILRFAEEAAQQVRNIYYGLTPAQLSVDGLASAIDELVSNTGALPHLRCSFRHDGRADVADLQKKLHLYRITQEAVHNALKHARARAIDINLRSLEGRLVLEIRDDGVGIDLEHREVKSLGIRSMSYRARVIGADLRIEQAPEGGTVVRCTMPLDPQQG